MSQILDVKAQDLTGFRDIYRFGPEFTMSVIKAGIQARKGPLIDYQIMGKLFTQMMVTNGKSLSIMRGKLTSSKQRRTSMHDVRLKEYYRTPTFLMWIVEPFPQPPLQYA